MEDRTLLAGLNAVIDDILLTQFPTSNPNPSGEFAFTSTSHAALVPNTIPVGTTVGGGTADLELTDVSLTFSNLAYVAGAWTGNVKVEAEEGVLFPGLLDIPVEDGDDGDAYGVAGNINLSVGNPTSRLALDDIDAEEIGIPAFLDIQFTSLALNFADFRGNENAVTLEAGIDFVGLDTGVEELNELMASDNPLFGLTLEGSADTTWDLAAIEDSVSASNPSSPSEFVSAFQEELAAEVGTDLQNGLSLNIAGKIFHVGDIAGTASYHTVTVAGETSGYIAVKGSFRVANEELGGRGPKFELAFAISDLGPLQFYISKSPTEDPPDVVDPPGTIKIESASFGVIFSKTIEQLQSGIDYFATAATTPVASGDTNSVTLTIAGHDLEEGDSFAIVQANGAPNYVGEYTVASVVGNAVTVLMETNPGPFAGSASIIRRTIKDPLDLRDDGLRTGINPPGSIEDWNNSLDASVRSLLAAGDDHWAQMFENMVIGGGATLSISDVPDTVLLMDVSMYLDTHLQAMLQGNLILADGVVQVPASLYGDLSDLVEGNGRFLFLADVGQVPLVDDPLLVVRGEASFEVIDDGFQIALEGGVDLNIPEATTITLEGDATLGFLSPSTGTAELQIDLGFDAALSEANIGDIAAARGNFHVAIDVPTPSDDPQQGTAEIWGAAILTTQFDFLEDVGLDVNASAVLRVNSSANDKLPEVLTDASDNEVQVDLPKESFALRLDGSADFSVNGGSVARLGGIFVLEFGAEGFNVALFDELNNQVVPASIAIGPAGSRILEFGVLGFLAIRDDGVAADLVLTADANLPLNLAHLEADAVFIVNTTSTQVTFDIPGGLDPNRSTGLSVTIPAAAPADPEAVLNAGLDNLITGSPSWTGGSAGPYGVVFLEGEMDLLSVLTVDVEGYFLLSKDLVTLKASFSADANFLNLAQASAHGTLFYNSQGEFLMDVGASAQLGPDWINIHGGADLAISYLDSDLLGSQGDRSPKLNVTGDLDVGLTIDIDPFPTVNLDLDLLTVAYKSATGEITVSVPYPEPFWDESCVDTVIFGVVCIPYPNVRTGTYTFSVGTLTATTEPPPTPVLGQVDANGVLTLNVGPNASTRKLLVDEVNEDVVIESPAVGSITVTMFGYSKTFDNVSRILIADMGSGKDAVEIKSSVSTPLEVHFGDGDDRLKNDGTGIVTAYGDAGRDQLSGGSAGDSLYGGTGEDTLDGKGGNDLIEGGDGGDKLIGGDGADTIRGGKGGDLIAGDQAVVTSFFADQAKTILTSSEFATTTSTSGGGDSIEGGEDIDIVFGGKGGDNISGNAGKDRLFGGDGKVTFASTTVTVVGSDLSQDGDDRMTWTVGDGDDVIDGQAGNDALDVVGTDASAEQVTISASGTGFTAGVGAESLSADRVEVSTIKGRGAGDKFIVNDLTTSLLRQVNLELGNDSVQDLVEVNGTSGIDVFNISTQPANVLRIEVPGGVKIDVKDTSSTSGGDTITLDTKAGADIINVRGTLAGPLTTVNGGDDADRIHVGSNATQASNTNGNLNGIAGKLEVQGGLGSDILHLDDTSDTAGNTGTLTATKITGLGMGTDGVTYVGMETLSVNLGSGGDTFNVQDTAGGTASTLNAGGGIDQVTVETTSLGGPITLDGQAAGDTYNIQLGSLAAAVTVSDSGASGSDVLNVDGIAGINNIVLERARLTRGTDIVNYNGVESLNIDTHDANDIFTMLDNGAVTTINSGSGGDEFTIGPAVNEDGEVLDANGNGTNDDEEAIPGTSFQMTINGGEGNDDFEVNRNTGELFLNGENGNDVFVLNTLIGGADSNVDGGGGVDTITYLQNAPVHINGGNGFDTIIVNGSKLNDAFIITGTSIEVVGSRVVEYVEIESVEVNGRRGLDTFTVDTTIDGEGNPVATSALQMLAVGGQQDNDLVELRGMLAGITATFSGGPGNDTFNLKSLGLAVTVNAIDGPVTISGDDDQDELNVNDTGDAIANTGSLTAGALTGLGMGSGVTYGTTEVLNISLGSGGNSFTIQDTHAGTTVLSSGSGSDTVNVRAVLGPTTVHAQAGADTIIVGSLAPASGGMVNQIALALTVNGGGDSDTLNVDDTGDATANSGCLTATTLTGLGMGAGITYGTVEALNISLGAGGNTFHVKATAAGTTTTLNSGDGNDVLAIDSNAAAANGTVNDVVSSLTINGQVGFNVLTMEDYSDSTGDVVHVTPTQVGAAAGDTFFGAGGSLTYTKLDKVTLNMSQAYLPDTLYLTPSRVTEFFIRGRDPQTPMQRNQLPGDALYLDFTGLTAAERLGVGLNATGLNNPADPVFNVWNIPGHGKVNYKQIEKMNHVQTLAVASDVGGTEPRVKVLDAETGLQKFTFLAYDPGFKGGVRVAVGDVNGDAIPDIVTAPGNGGGPRVRVFNGATGLQFTEPIGEFFAFPAGSKTTVHVAVGDINLDGLADIVTGSDSGGEPIVKVFDAHKLLTGQANPMISQFLAYDRSFTGGVRLAVGDLNGDGVLDISTGPGSGLNAQVRVFKTILSTDQTTVTHSLLSSFSAFPRYNGGVNLAVGDVNGDGRADLVAGTAAGGTAMTRIYNGATIGSSSPTLLLTDHKPFGSQSGGVRVALVDLDGDGVNELITSSALTGSKVKPRAWDLIPNGQGKLNPAAIDAFFARYTSDPFFQGSLFLGSGN